MQVDLRKLVLAVIFGVLTALAGRVAVTALLLPAGLESLAHPALFLALLVALLAGLVLGATYGLVSQVIFVAIVLAGAPIFSAVGGLALLSSPVGGYVLGFVPAAWLAGRMANVSHEFPRRFLAALLGLAAAHWVAVLWLAYINGYSAGPAFAQGSGPFIFVDALKAVMAAALVPATVFLADRLPISGVKTITLGPSGKNQPASE